VVVLFLLYKQKDLNIKKIFFKSVYEFENLVIAWKFKEREEKKERKKRRRIYYSQVGFFCLHPHGWNFAPERSNKRPLNF